MTESEIIMRLVQMREKLLNKEETLALVEMISDLICKIKETEGAHKRGYNLHG